MPHSLTPKAVFKGVNLLPFTIAVTFGAVLWLLPTPAGINIRAWHLFAIFGSVIVALIGKALPMGGISFLALTVATATQTLSTKEAFSGFSHPVVWLVVASFFISRSLIKTGLGLRVAYLFVAALGKTTLGLSYGLCATDLMLAPAMPSSTARGGGILFPIVRALALNFDSSPEKHSQRRIGSFLILTAYYSNLITSAMFVTAIAVNPMIVTILQQAGYPITWAQWTMAAALPGIISLITVPLLVYKFYPPELKRSPEAQKIALEKLHAMGAISKYEWITIAVFALLVTLWSLGETFFGVDSTIVALIGVSLLMVTGVLTWEDIKREHEAWDTLCWFSTLVMIATSLKELGFIYWISNYIQSGMEGVVWWSAWPLLTLLYFYSHYLFASNTPHVASMFAPFFQVGIALAIPPYLLGFSLGFSSSLFACTTHYGTGCAPIFFGSEYVNLKNWWKMGAFMSIVFLLIWIGIGSLWWKFLGFW